MSFWCWSHEEYFELDLIKESLVLFYCSCSCCRIYEDLFVLLCFLCKEIDRKNIISPAFFFIYYGEYNALYTCRTTYVLELWYPAWCFADRYLSFFYWSLCCLFFFHLWLLTSSVVSPNFSYNNLFTQRYSWNTAKFGVKDQSINTTVCVFRVTCWKAKLEQICMTKYIIKM